MITVRRTKPGDEAALVALFSECQPAFDTAPAIFQENFDAELYANGSALLAVRDDVPLGMVCYSTSDERRVIDFLAVTEAERKKGVGRLLLEQLHEITSNDGQQSLMAVIWPLGGAEPFYERLGYAKVAHVMELSL